MRIVRRLSWLFGLALALATVASAQTFESVPQAKPAATAPAEGSGLKIGVINVQLAMIRTQEGRKASEDLQAKFVPRQVEMQKLQEEMRALEDQLRTQERTLSDEARAQILRDLDLKRKQGTRMQQDLQDESEDAQAAVLNQLGQKMKRILDRFVAENRYDIILNSSPGSSMILFATPTVDITDDIVKLYDQTYPVQAAQQKPPPASSSQPPKKQ